MHHDAQRLAGMRCLKSVITLSARSPIATAFITVPDGDGRLTWVAYLLGVKGRTINPRRSSLCVRRLRLLDRGVLKLAQCNVELFIRPFSEQVEFHGRSWLAIADLDGEIGSVHDLFAVELENDIPWLETGFGRRTSRLDGAHEGTIWSLQTESVR